MPHHTLAPLCLASAVAYCVQAVLMFGLATYLRGGAAGLFPVTMRIMWPLGDDSNNNNVTLAGEFDARFAVASGLGLGAAAMVLATTLAQPFAAPVACGVVALVRHTDQSVTAPVFLITVAVQAGLNDMYLLEHMFVLASVSAVLDLAADAVSAVASQRGEPFLDIFGRWAWVPFHVAMCSALLSAYAPLLDVVLQGNARPPAVVAMAAVQILSVAASVAVQCAAYLASSLHAPAQQDLSLVFDDPGSPTSVVPASLHWWGDHGVLLHDPEGAPPTTEADRLLGIATRAEAAHICVATLTRTLVAWLTVGPLL